MCGIVGYVGAECATPVLVNALRKLEYRGYDSAGIAVADGNELVVRKAKGELACLERRLAAEFESVEACRGKTGIGHTRWATHGEPSDVNAHPHLDAAHSVAVVHNGIIENHALLRKKLASRGVVFESQTDTEVIAHLISLYYKDSLLSAVQRALGELEGSYALAVLCKNEPHTIVAARRDSPLVVGTANGGAFVASDVTPLLEHTRDVYYVDDGETVCITQNGVAFYDENGAHIEKKVRHIEWDVEAAEKGGYAHFMLKEIHEQPKALTDALRTRLCVDGGAAVDTAAIARGTDASCGVGASEAAGERAPCTENAATDDAEHVAASTSCKNAASAATGGTFDIPSFDVTTKAPAVGAVPSCDRAFDIPSGALSVPSPNATAETLPRLTVNLSEIGGDELWTKARRVVICGCGTAYHAGIVGKYALEHLARIPVDADVASEYRYRAPLFDANDIFIILSQSGETADTLSAMRMAKNAGARIIAITNVVASTLAREADAVMYTNAGPEIAVASTKAFTTQLMCLYLIALKAAVLRGTISAHEAEAYKRELLAIPQKVQKILSQSAHIKRIAAETHTKTTAFFMGRLADYAISLEAALKLKEVSYMHSEAFAAGELKHGPIALVDAQMLVIAICTQTPLFDKMESNIKEVKARGATVLCITFQDEPRFDASADAVLRIPRTDCALTPLLSIVPCQLYAYFCALLRGTNPDKPRNLAKSVTVE